MRSLPSGSEFKTRTRPWPIRVGRLRRGEKLHEADFLEGEVFSPVNLDLQKLTGRLREETAISRRVEERLMGERPGSCGLDGGRTCRGWGSGWER